MAAARIIRDVCFDREPMFLQQGSALVGGEAAAIQRLAFEVTDCASLFVSAGEHERRTGTGVRCKPGEYLPLIGW